MAGRRSMAAGALLQAAPRTDMTTVHVKWGEGGGSVGDEGAGERGRGGANGEANGRGTVRESGGGNYAIDQIQMGRGQNMEMRDNMTSPFVKQMGKMTSKDDAEMKTDDVMARDVTGVINNCVNDDVMMKDVGDVINIDDDISNIDESIELKKFDTVT